MRGSYLFITILTLLFTTNLYANNDKTSKIRKGKLSGIVTDGKTKQPLAYSTIRLFNSQDSSLVKGVITNTKGFFEIKDIDFGNYYTKIDFIGYKSKTVRFVINPNDKEKKLAIFLDESSYGIQEVNVTAEKKLMQNTVEKKVFNLSKNTTIEGGNSLNALQSIPSVSVDIDGKVSYRGSDNVVILINGEQSALINKGNTQGLEQITSDMIDKIEVISNPSAKYDAEGMAGIINIKLKKNKRQGISSGFNIAAGLDEILNASVMHSRTGENASFYISGGINHKNFYQTKEHYRSNYGNPDASDYYNFDDLQNDKNFGSLNTSLSIKTGSKSNINFSALYNKEKSSADRHIDYESFDKARNSVYTYFKDIDTHIDGYNFDGTANFVQNYKEGKSLKIYTAYSILDKDTKMDNSVFENADDTKPQLQNTKTEQRNTMYKYGVDYKHTINKSSVLEIGYKGSTQNIGNDFYSHSYNQTSENWNQDTDLDNMFDYRETINALYANYSGKLVWLDLDMGLRLEHSDININDEIKDNYLSLFPVVTISKNMGKSTVFLGYNRRINRPKLMMINPYTDEYADVLNMHKGNPYLKHEFVNSIETGWNFKSKGANLSTTMYFRNIDNAISRVKSAVNDSALVVSYVNLEKAHMYGGEFTGSFYPCKILDITAGLNLFYTQLEGVYQNNIMKKDQWGWNAKMNTTLRLPHKINFQLAGYYRSKMPTVLGTIAENYYFDLGISKKILKNKGMLTFKISDIFDTNSYKPFVDAVDENNFRYSQTNERKIESRFFVLNLKYNFSSNGKDKKKANDKYFLEGLEK